MLESILGVLVVLFLFGTIVRAKIKHKSKVKLKLPKGYEVRKIKKKKTKKKDEKKEGKVVNLE